MGGRGFRTHGKVVWPGFSNTPSPRHVAKVRRNDPCPCGSGKKYKDCHEAEGETFLQKLYLENEKQRVRERRERLKEQGVPWYRRLFVR